MSVEMDPHTQRSTQTMEQLDIAPTYSRGTIILCANPG